jgi:CheY-like chemotaxis protein
MPHSGAQRASPASDGPRRRQQPDGVAVAGSCEDRGVVRTVLIVDDHADFRAAARTLLEAGGFMVAEAADGRSAVAVCTKFHPDLVLLDVQLPDVDGFSVAEQLVGQSEVVLVSSRPASSYRGRLAATSAAGFLTKSDLTLPALTAPLKPG